VAANQNKQCATSRKYYLGRPVLVRGKGVSEHRRTATSPTWTNFDSTIRTSRVLRDVMGGSGIPHETLTNTIDLQ